MSITPDQTLEMQAYHDTFIGLLYAIDPMQTNFKIELALDAVQDIDDNGGAMTTGTITITPVDEEKMKIDRCKKHEFESALESVTENIAEIYHKNLGTLVTDGEVDGNAEFYNEFMVSVHFEK